MRLCRVCNSEIEKNNKNEYQNLVHFDCLMKLSEGYRKVNEDLKKQNSDLTEAIKQTLKQSKVWETRFQESIFQAQQFQKEANICIDDLKNSLLILSNEIEGLKKKKQVLVNLFENCCKTRDQFKLERDTYKQQVENFKNVLQRIKGRAG